MAYPRADSREANLHEKRLRGDRAHRIHSRNRPFSEGPIPLRNGAVPVSPYRASESFEELRLATESFTAKTGNTPRVFLLTIGDLAMRMARANFSLNFFGCAGFDVIDNLGLETVDQGVEAASESGAEIVVICSSDQEYASVAPEICKKIKSANPNIFVIVAGLPKDIAYELKASGIDDFIHARTNAVELLSKYQKLLNINR